MSERVDLRGRLPETWCCLDCGVNTAPGLSSRAEAERRFNAGEDRIEQTYDDRSEVYTVRDWVWAAAGIAPMGGVLCIGCLEQRLGRRLRSKDFSRYDALNVGFGSPRLLQRRGKRLVPLLWRSALHKADSG